MIAPRSYGHTHQCLARVGPASMLVTQMHGKRAVLSKPFSARPVRILSTTLASIVPIALNASPSRRGSVVFAELSGYVTLVLWPNTRPISPYSPVHVVEQHIAQKKMDADTVTFAGIAARVAFVLVVRPWRRKT